MDISTNSVLHSVSNNNSFDQSFNSLIKLSNSDNIEGYTLVDAYEKTKAEIIMKNAPFLINILYLVTEYD